MFQERLPNSHKNVIKSSKNKKPKLEEFEILKELKDVFQEEMSRLSPRKEVYFSIELSLEYQPSSKFPYKMSTTKPLEMKTQLDELLENDYVSLSVSLWKHQLFLWRKRIGPQDYALIIGTCNVPIKHWFTLLRIWLLWDHMKGPKFFPKVDLKSG